MKNENKKSPSGESFEIRTLRDIWELPTLEQMEVCLRELSSAMTGARATSHLMVSVAESLGLPANAMTAEWPEVTTWQDDGKGEIGAVFTSEGQDLFEIRNKKEGVSHG